MFLLFKILLLSFTFHLFFSLVCYFCLHFLLIFFTFCHFFSFFFFTFIFCFHHFVTFFHFLLLFFHFLLLLFTFCDFFSSKYTFFDNVLFYVSGLVKYDPMRTSSYLPLPKELKAKQGGLNIEHNDDKCFLWSILTSLHPL